MNKKPIIIVNGEPYSVFFEIFFKSIKKYKSKKPIILIGSKKLISQQIKKFKFNLKINLIDQNKINFNKINNKRINVINVDLPLNYRFFKISKSSKNYITKCFNISLTLLKTKKFSGLINGPVSKKHFLQNKFLGITEYLAKKTKIISDFAMLIYEKNLSVCPITTHLPLKAVSKNLSKKKIISKAELIKNFFIKNFKKNPRIAITGLNPHCESFERNSEEKKFIIPAIKYLKKKNFYISGPLPADTIFLKQNVKKFDVIIGMYHDQVLPPAKALYNFTPINITLGLPFVRISPDHGPNESMVGKNLSNPQSLIEAIKFLNNKC